MALCTCALVFVPHALQWGDVTLFQALGKLLACAPQTRSQTVCLFKKSLQGTELAVIAELNCNKPNRLEEGTENILLL